MRRADDVCEQHGQQRTGRLGPPALAGHELLDLADDRLRVAERKSVILASEFDESRPGYEVGESAGGVDGNEVVAAVKHQGGHVDALGCGRDVDLAQRLKQGPRHARAGGGTLVRRHGPTDAFTACCARCEYVNHLTLAPVSYDLLQLPTGIN